MDAINEILLNPRYRGAIENISWLTSIMDSISVQIITVVAFFIMSSSVLKNVVAGAYATWPKLFDKVADFKQQGKDFAKGHRSREFGMIASILFSFIPNFKEISDFADDTVEPKDYFIKAIPQMVLTVMIGITIYNGYQRDLMAVTGTFASTIFERAMAQVDPIAFFDDITHWGSDPTFASDGEDTDIGKYTLKLSDDMYSAIISKYTDIKSEESKAILGGRIEEWARSTLLTHSEYLDSDRYDFKLSVEKVPEYRDISNHNTVIDDVTKFAYMKPISDFQIDSTLHTGENWHLRIILQFTRKAEGVKSQSFNNLIVNIPTNSITTQNGRLLVDLPQGASIVTGGAMATTLTAGDVTYRLNVQGNTVEIYRTTGDVEIGDVEDIEMQVTYGNLFYKVNGKHNGVIKVKVDTNISDIEITDESARMIPMTFGDIPRQKSTTD